MGNVCIYNWNGVVVEFWIENSSRFLASCFDNFLVFVVLNKIYATWIVSNQDKIDFIYKFGNMDTNF